MRRSAGVKLHDILIGGSVGTVLGIVLAQSFDPIPAAVTGIIMGFSVAYSSSTMAKQADD